MIASGSVGCGSAGRALAVGLALFCTLGVPAQAQEKWVSCALRVLARSWVSQPIAADEENRLQSNFGENMGSAVLIKHQGDLYIATAYHVIRRCETVRFNAGDFMLEVGNDNFVRNRFYYNRLADLAIFGLGKEGVKRVEHFNLSPATLPANTSPAAVLGRAAVAIGNPKIEVQKTLMPLNIIYSGTLSEMAKANDRFDLGDDLTPEDRARVAGDEKVREFELLFLETLSITRGFSGGPILIPPAPDGKAQLVGVVLGGHP